MIVSVNGIDLYYEKTGEGRPLVLLHGNGEDHTIFNEAIAFLKNHYACYCVDSRGHGQSTPVDTYHYTDMAEDMVTMVNGHWHKGLFRLIRHFSHRPQLEEKKKG